MFIQWFVVQGWMNFLHQMALKLPVVSNLKSLKVLCTEDGEVNFFDDITDSVVCSYSKFFMIICLPSLFSNETTFFCICLL